MATSLAGRRRVVSSDVFKLGWCMGTFGTSKASHEKRDENGERVHGTCPGSIVSSVDTKNYKAGTVVYCGCECHRQFQEDPSEPRPEAWPGRVPVLRVADDDDEQDDEPQETPPDADTDEMMDTSSEDRRGTSGSPGVTAKQLHDLPDSIPGETRRIRYNAGWVVRITVEENGKTYVRWTPYRFGVPLTGSFFALREAKDALMKEHES